MIRATRLNERSSTPDHYLITALVYLRAYLQLLEEEPCAVRWLVVARAAAPLASLILTGAPSRRSRAECALTPEAPLLRARQRQSRHFRRQSRSRLCTADHPRGEYPAQRQDYARWVAHRLGAGQRRVAWRHSASLVRDARKLARAEEAARAVAREAARARVVGAMVAAASNRPWVRVAAAAAGAREAAAAPAAERVGVKVAAGMAAAEAALAAAG